jgi:hypothetical protein
MEIRVTISGGRAQVETISMLEDLWHDFGFFKSQALRFEHQDATANDRLVAKRYQRAALLTLIFYLEGVLNQWLKELLAEAEWSAIERKCLELKIAKIQERVPAVSEGLPEIAETKRIRNALAHLKPGGDLELYDKINRELLESTEASVMTWLDGMERVLGVPRHPNTESESKELRDALGTTDPNAGGYSDPTRG